METLIGYDTKAFFESLDKTPAIAIAVFTFLSDVQDGKIPMLSKHRCELKCVSKNDKKILASKQYSLRQKLVVLRRNRSIFKTSKSIFKFMPSIQHFPDKNTVLKICRVCYKNGIRRRTIYTCNTCLTRPGMCKEYFVSFHKSIQSPIEFYGKSEPSG